jgi:hypothetical protein
LTAISIIVVDAIEVSSRRSSWSKQSPAATANLLADDPRPGLTIALPVADTLGHKFKRQPTLVIATGGCTECSVRTIQPKDVMFDGQIVFCIDNMPGDALPREYANLPARDLVVDGLASKHLLAHLNPLWTGRWYIFDAGGKLASFQRRPEDSRPTSYIESMAR